MGEQRGGNLKIKYHQAGGESLKDKFKALPKGLIPTKKTGYIFGVIFLLVIVYGIISFPFGKMMSGSIEGLEVKVGLPWDFLIFDLMNPESAPIRVWGLVGDILIYILLSYAIDIAINLFLNNPLFESQDERKKRPQLFKDVKKKNVDTNFAAESYLRDIKETAKTPPLQIKKEAATGKKIDARTTFVKEGGWLKQKEI